MRFSLCSITMEKQKKRKAKWAECKYCKARNLPIVFRSGKRKCLEKHMAICKNDYLLECQVASRTDSHALVRTVRLLSQQVADLQARVKVLELKKDRYYVERDQFWSKLTPKLAWKRAKENTVRLLSVYLRRYVPVRWYKNKWEWLAAYYVSPKIQLHDILSFGLWPVLATRENRTVLRGCDSTDHFHMFKRVWGKTQLPDLGWFRAALEELKLPPDIFIDDIHLRDVENEFQRILIRYQSTKRRNDSKWIPQGLVALVKLWEKMYPIDDEVREACTCLGPNENLKWERPESPNPHLSEPGEAHDENTCVLGPQS
jgi:hypothetical protein